MAFNSNRRHEYVEGNTVRKIQPLERPEKRQRQKHHKRKAVYKEQIQYVNVLYTVFLSAAAVMVLWSCVNYLQLQAETTSRVKNIAALETQLENLRKENEDRKSTRLNSSHLIV